MPTNFKRTFGNATSPLALSYLDDNFSQLEAAGTSTVTLSGAQLIGYMQSGTGAVSETTQAALRRLISSAQYATNANFIAAVDVGAATSETIGFYCRNIRLQSTPVIQSIEFGDNIVLSSNVDNSGATFGSDDGATDQFKLNLFRKDVPAGVPAVIGRLGFEGKMSGGGTTTFSVITGVATDLTDAAPVGEIRIRTVSGSETLADRVTINASTTTINTGSLAITDAILTSGNTTGLSLKTSGGTQVAIEHVASAVNRIQLAGAVLGGTPYVLSTGSDTNVNLGFITRGTGEHIFGTGPNLLNAQLRILHTASSSRYVTVTGSNGGNPTIATSAGNLAITPAIIGAATSGNALGGATSSSSTALILPAGTTGISSLRVPHGSAPTSPVDGDIWTTSAGLFVRINGGTVGPLS